jgi:hypothetical protein
MNEKTDYKWTVYGVTCPTSGKVVYVGLTKNPKKRLREHCKDARNGRSSPLRSWIRSVLDAGKRPGFVWLEEGVGIDSGSCAERRWIDQCNQETPLLNRNPGGVDSNVGAFKQLCEKKPGRVAPNRRPVKSLSTNQVFDSMTLCAEALQTTLKTVHRAVTCGYRVHGHDLVYADASDASRPSRRAYKTRARTNGVLHLSEATR